MNLELVLFIVFPLSWLVNGKLIFHIILLAIVSHEEKLDLKTGVEKLLQMGVLVNTVKMPDSQICLTVCKLHVNALKTVQIETLQGS